MGFGEVGSSTTSSTPKLNVRELVPQSNSNTGLNVSENKQQQQQHQDLQPQQLASFELNNTNDNPLLTPIGYCITCALDLEDFDLTLIGDIGESSGDTAADKDTTNQLFEFSGEAAEQILTELDLEGGNPSKIITSLDELPTQSLGHELAYSSEATLLGGAEILSTITTDSVALAEVGLSSSSLIPAGNSATPMQITPVSALPQESQARRDSLPPFSDLVRFPVPQTFSSSEPSFQDIIQTLGILANAQNRNFAKRDAFPKIKRRQNRPHYSNRLPKIIVGGVQMDVESWAKAFMEVEKGVSKAANVLFDHLITDSEVLTSTKSGRGQTRALNPAKLGAIKMAVSWMYNNRRDSQNPYNYRPQDAGSLPKDEMTLVEKVFIDRRNERKRKLKKKNKAPGKPSLVARSRPRCPRGRKSKMGQLSPGESSSTSGSSTDGGTGISLEIHNIIETMASSAADTKCGEDDDAPSPNKRPRM